MKRMIQILMIFHCGLLFSQRENVAPTEGKATGLQELTDSEFRPEFFLGQITNNSGVSNLELDLAKEILILQGVLFRTPNERWVSTVNIQAKNENNIATVFSGGNINPKAKFDLSFTYNFPKLARHGKLDSNLQASKDFDKIIKDPVKYKLSSIRHKYLTFGFNAEGAKYYLIDTMEAYSNMVKKEKYTGWQTYLQYNFFNFYNKRKFSTAHTFQITYGEVNNAGELDAFDITNTSTFVNGNASKKFERKRTGYIDPYIFQHRAVFSYEFNFYNMDLSDPKLGLIAGFDFVYNERQNNFWRFNGGLNFPVKLKPKEGESRSIYVGAIASTTDPFNDGQNADFDFKNSFSFSLRLASKVKIGFKKAKKNKSVFQ